MDEDVGVDGERMGMVGSMTRVGRLTHTFISHSRLPPLPVEAFLSLLSYFSDPQDAITLMLVCKEWSMSVVTAFYSSPPLKRSDVFGRFTSLIVAPGSFHTYSLRDWRLRVLQPMNSKLVTSKPSSVYAKTSPPSNSPHASTSLPSFSRVSPTFVHTSNPLSCVDVPLVTAFYLSSSEGAPSPSLGSFRYQLPYNFRTPSFGRPINVA
ncbi:hypothetical protein BC829DRAFT_122101 [Chytridium lagenaria]|nr:hypothetical protein BC829DRAFT_122101 [Chytridium lagenaria]